MNGLNSISDISPIAPLIFTGGHTESKIGHSLDFEGLRFQNTLFCYASIW